MKKIITLIMCFLLITTHTQCAPLIESENADSFNEVACDMVKYLKKLEKKNLTEEEILVELSQHVEQCVYSAEEESKSEYLQKLLPILAASAVAVVGVGGLVWYFCFKQEKTSAAKPVVSPQDVVPTRTQSRVVPPVEVSRQQVAQVIPVVEQPRRQAGNVYTVRTQDGQGRAVNLVLVDGDVTAQQFVDPAHAAIVNAANAHLVPGGGVCGAVFRAAGPALIQECRQVGGCPTGGAVITNGGNLQPVRIIHAVGPIGVNPVQLRNAYQATLQVADNNQVTQVALPAISTGIYGYSVENATPVALDAIVDYVQQNNTQLNEIRLVNMGEQRMNIYRNALNNHQNIVRLN